MTSTFLEELRAMKARLRENAHKTLDVPGTGGKYCVRYRPPDDRDALTPALAALATEGAMDAAEELQLIVDCCDEVLVREKPGAEPAQPEGGPLRFDGGDERWGDNVTTAREAVAELFSLDTYPLAAARHTSSLIDWLQGLDAEIEARVEGKFESGATS